MLESSVFGLIGSPLACVLFLLVAGVIAARVTLPARREKKQDDFEFRMERRELTREEARRVLQADMDRNQRENDSGAWWNP